MLKQVLFFLPLMCLVASHPRPQEVEISQTFEAEVPLTPADQCDYYSCNGLQLELNHINGQKVEAGQCLINVDGDPKKFFCYVNEDSVCEKTKTEFGYISYEPCNHPTAVVRRNFSWQGLWDWAKNIFSYITPQFSVEGDISYNPEWCADASRYDSRYC